MWLGLIPIGRTKAVANGALAWALNNSVTTRINKYHYGCEVNAWYSPQDPTMVGRTVHVHVSGRKVVHGAWSNIIAQVTLVYYLQVSPDPTYPLTGSTS
jgi:hypothetical protein